MVADSVGRYEDKPALFFGDQVLTYRELWEHAGQVKNHLLQREGIAPGDRVALWMGNCPEFIILLIGILRSGAVAVPLNHFLTPPEADGILKDAQATVIFSDADRIEARVFLESNPMPPAGGVPEEELEAVAEWLDCGMPE